MLVCLAVFAVAVGMRTIPLYWSPFPSTLDGFGYAALTRDTIALHHFPLTRFRADNFGFAGLLAVVSMLVDVSPLKMAQPLIALVGAASCLTAVAITRRIAWNLGLPSRQIRVAATLAGLTLAVEGIYLRRTGVPDEEAIGLLLIPLLAISLHRALRTQRMSWIALTVVFMIVFPLTHTFSTLIAAMTVLALLAVHLLRTPLRRLAIIGAGLVAGFWIYFAVYYEFAARTVLTVPYVGRVLSAPGLFIAWLIVLVTGVLWLRGTSPRMQRGTVLAVIGSGYVLLAANAIIPIFPATIPTPLPILAIVLLFLIPVVLASRALPLVTTKKSEGAVVLALFAAPVVQVYFSLTASLTPEFFGTVIRAQTFAHFPIFILAALATVVYTVRTTSSLDTRNILRSQTGRRVAVSLLLVSALLTAPIAFVDLDTVSYPSTTTESEFATVTFATNYVNSTWVSDHPLTNIGNGYYPTRTNASLLPVVSWLTGGLPPTCPTISRRSWVTTGAHLYPTAPETINKTRYEEWLTQRNLIYTASGSNPSALTVPAARTENGC